MHMAVDATGQQKLAIGVNYLRGSAEITPEHRNAVIDMPTSHLKVSRLSRSCYRESENRDPALARSY